MKLPKISAPPFAVLAALALVALVGLQLAMEQLWLAPLQQEDARLAAELQRQRSLPATPAKARAKSAGQLQDVLTRLEGQGASARRVEAMHAMADARGVALRKVNYRTLATAGDITHHEVQLDLAGAYPGMREFLRDLLEQDSAAAIESLEFSRPSASGGVRAQVRVALYFRKNGANATP